jgi:hypothetical protein
MAALSLKQGITAAHAFVANISGAWVEFRPESRQNSPHWGNLPAEFRKCPDLIVVVSALCADFEPQARRYSKTGHCRIFRCLLRARNYTLEPN